MKVFIDTNIYINFIRTSDEKLKSLGEIEKLIKSRQISLIFPKITLEEFIRNIPIIALEYKKIIEQQLPKKPPFAASIDAKRRERINKTHNEYKEELGRLKKHYLKSVDAVKKKVIEDLWGLAIKLEDTPELINKAHARKIKGNPPGKGHRIGDELEWEILLDSCCDDNLTIITFDEDWFDLMNYKKGELNPLLKREWDEKTNKKKKIHIFKTVGEFINKLAGKTVISPKEIEKEKKGSGWVSGFPYTFPVTFASSVSPSVSYPGTATIQPATSTSWSASPSTITTSTSTLSGGTVSVSTSSSGSFRCKNCGAYSFLDFNFCPYCGTKKD